MNSIKNTSLAGIGFAALTKNLASLSTFAAAFLISLTSSAQGTGFLWKSKLLADAKVMIQPAQIAEQKFVLSAVEPGPEQELHLIEERGLIRLEKQNSAQKIKLNIHNWGSPAFSSPWIRADGQKPTGLFVVTGKIPPGFDIKWMKAKEATEHIAPVCARYKKYYVKKQFAAAKIEGVSGNVFFAEYETPKSKPDQAPDCNKPDVSVQKVGISAKDRCEVLLEAPIDCEGQGYSRGSMSKPLGMLEIIRGSSKEQWLVFDAKGYEGDAVLGIRYDGTRPLKKDDDIDFYIYSGG